MKPGPVGSISTRYQSHPPTIGISKVVTLELVEPLEKRARAALPHLHLGVFLPRLRQSFGPSTPGRLRLPQFLSQRHDCQHSHSLRGSSGVFLAIR